ncbi:MAG: hypothetical protein H3C62_06535 [Gemmatimonadaceae bacterium]|nr:hypothetical protein [Gemmatimonadaceae bacterium]
MLALLLALQLTVPPARPQTDSAVRARADSTILAFQREWREAWQSSQMQLGPSAATDRADEQRLRVLALHCHWIATSPRVQPHVITGTMIAHATCPIWYPPDAEPVPDERRGIDGALTMTRRWRVRQLRQQLRAHLDTAAQLLPGDAHIAAQRLRFALDDGDAQGAIQAAASCAEPEGYCGMLRAFVLHRAGRTVAADSAFLNALKQMPAETRCIWSNVGVLLDGAPRKAYDALPCESRASFETRFWQLADPLWSEPGNERRAEQFARQVLLTLLAPLGEDERQRWAPEKGGEAVGESLLRYGWPTHFWWAGVVADNGHDGWLLRTAGADTAQPYVVREYSRDQLHTVPSARAIAAPLQAAATDWTLYAPATDDPWWPHEHFARDGGRLLQLAEGQSVMLRRRNGTRVAWAVDADTSLWGSRAARQVHAELFDATRADTTRRLALFTTRPRHAVVVDALLAPGRSLLGVEVHSEPEFPAARTRFSVDVAPTLEALERRCRSRRLSKRPVRPRRRFRRIRLLRGCWGARRCAVQGVLACTGRRTASPNARRWRSRSRFRARTSQGSSRAWRAASGSGARKGAAPACGGRNFRGARRH